MEVHFFDDGLSLQQKTLETIRKLQETVLCLVLRRFELQHDVIEEEVGEGIQREIGEEIQREVREVIQRCSADKKSVRTSKLY